MSDNIPLPKQPEIINLDRHDTELLNDITGVSERNKLRHEVEFQNEKRKASKWTQEDLLRLANTILDHDLGNPREFLTDMSTIKDALQKEKQNLDGIEKEKITAEGRDLLYGLLITNHITKQGFAIEVSADDQPILHETQKSTPARKAQLDGLQKVLSTFEFQFAENSILKRNDNITEIASYLAAAAYHLKKNPNENLLEYRTGLEKEVGKSNPPTQKEILASKLTASQKSFLLSWNRKNERTDKQLLKISENQEIYVAQARENFNKKSDAQNLQELINNPFTKGPELYAVGAAGIALLAVGIKVLIGKGGFWKKTGAVLLTLVGGMVAAPILNKGWQKIGGPEMLSNDPKDRADAKDNTFIRVGEWTKEKVMEGWEISKDGISRMVARMQGADEWTNLIIDKNIGPEISKIPVGSMLYALAANGADKGKLEDYKVDAEVKNAEKLIKKLTPEQKNTLTNLLSTTWDRYKAINEKRFAKRNLNAIQALHLPDVIHAIDVEDSWFNALLDGLTSEGKKLPGLAIMGQNAKEWGDMTVDQIERYFSLNGKIRKDLSTDEIKALDKITDMRKINLGKSNFDLMKEYFQSKIQKDYPLSRNTSLRDFLVKQS